MLLFIVYFGLAVFLAFVPCLGFYYPVICHGKTDEKTIAITFDDGPDKLKTPLILDILTKYGVKATFFFIGKNLTGNEQLVKQIYEEGHLIGNHSFSHSGWFDLFPARKIRSELLETDRLIKKITGRSPLFFRPPFGVVNPLVAKALKNMHWKAVCWDIRSLDTKGQRPEKTMHRIISTLKPGSVILLHDGTTFSGNYLGDLISKIRDAGYGIVSLDKLLNLPAYA